MKTCFCEVATAVAQVTNRKAPGRYLLKSIFVFGDAFLAYAVEGLNLGCKVQD